MNEIKEKLPAWWHLFTENFQKYLKRKRLLHHLAAINFMVFPMENWKIELKNFIEKYRSLGWEVVPLKGKIPIVKEWSSESIEVERYLNKRVNLGIKTGRCSNGLLALDIDQPELLDFDYQTAILQGAMVHNTFKGWRVVFYANEELCKLNRKIQLKLEEINEEDKFKLFLKGNETSISVIELLGDGRQFMAPPSIHPEGRKLEWITQLKDKSTALCIYSKKELRTFILSLIKNPKYWWVADELVPEESCPAGNFEFLRSLLAKIREVLQPRFVGETPGYFIYHCPFHPSNEHPSFAINKEKFYGIDYHDGSTYNLKELAKRLHVQLPIAPYNIYTEQVGIQSFEAVRYIDAIKSVKKISWIVEEILPNSSLCLLAGKGSTGKTWLALQLAKQIAKGEKVFGWFRCKKTGVLLIDEENDLEIHRQRAEMLGIRG